MEKKLQFIAISFMVLVLTACGGGSGGGGSTASIGKFVDGQVEGLGYSSAAYTGVTGVNGTYNYVTGQNVKFYVGNIDLGEAPAKALMTPLHLFPGSNATTPQVVNMVRFFMSIGTVNANNSITIPQAAADAASKVPRVNISTLAEAELLALVKALKGNAATLVDEATAKAHLSGSILNEYKGSYKGVFSGVKDDPDRTWAMVINSDGTIVGQGSNKINKYVNGQIVLDFEKISGTISNGTELNAEAAGGCKMTGKLDVITGILRGTWVNPSKTDENGTFSGKI